LTVDPFEAHLSCSSFFLALFVASLGFSQFCITRRGAIPRSAAKWILAVAQAQEKNPFLGK
jgi:hypothetical protein